MIYQVLTAQNFPQEATGEMYEETRTLTFSRKLLTADRLQDLPYVPSKDNEVHFQQDPFFEDLDRAYAELNEEARLDRRQQRGKPRRCSLGYQDGSTKLKK